MNPFFSVNASASRASHEFFTNRADYLKVGDK